MGYNKIYRKAYFAIGFFLLSLCFLHGQDQGIADSVKLLLESDDTYDSIYLARVQIISEEETDPKIKKKFAENLISLALNEALDSVLISGYLQKGNAERLQGNFSAALEAYFESLRYAQKIKDLERIGSLNTSIADVYSETNNMDNAMIYYNTAITTLKQTSDTVSLAGTLLNAGDAYFYAKKYDSALIYNSEATELFKDLNYSLGTAYALGNMGMVYAELGKDKIAELNIKEGIDILEELGDFYPITVYLTYMSDIYVRKNEFPKALSYAKRSLDLAKRHNLKDQISDANLKLAELYELADNKATAYEYFKDHIVYRDSVKNLETIEQMADQRTNFEVSQKQVEVDLLNQQKKTQKIIAYATGIGLFMVGILAFGLFRRNSFIQKTKKIIEEERDRSDTLLLNILPEKTARELKESGKVKAQKFDSVTVLFTDFKGFTQYSSKLSPEQLVETVSFYFSKFDEIVERHGLEKIKTIGDAYMCAGGLPFPSEDHATKMINAAFEIANFVESTRNNKSAVEMDFDIRIGINTGPVVAGVVGSKKFAYDIWGDTVNVASRMEAASEAGKINISENTYKLIKDSFNCTYRGELQVKNKGAMKMYFVDSSKEAVKLAAV